MHPEDMLSVLGSFPIFSIVNFPSSSDSEEFQVNGNEKFKENYAWNQWDDFPFGMILIRGKWFEFKINIKSNKLKMKQTATEWSLLYIVKKHQGQEFSLKHSTAVITVPVTNAWPERGASAVKRIKSRLRSIMKMDLLNTLLMILMNGPTNNSKEARLIIQKATKRYQSSKWCQILGLTKVIKEKVKNVSFQTTNILDNNLIEAVSDIKNTLNHKIDNLNCYVQTNFDTTSNDEADDGN